MFQTRVFSLVAVLALLYYPVAMVPLAVFAYETDGRLGSSGNFSVTEVPDADDESLEETISHPDVDDAFWTEGDDHSGGYLPIDGPEDEDMPLREEDLEPELEDLLTPENDENANSDGIDETMTSGIFSVVRESFEPSLVVRVPDPLVEGSLATGSRILPDETPRLPDPRPTEPAVTEPDPIPTHSESTPPVDQGQATGNSDGKDGSRLPQTGIERARPWLIGLGLVGASGAAIYFKNKQD